MSKFLDSKHSVLHIKNKDFLCLARALVTHIAQQEKHPEWNSIRQGHKQQQLLAQKLHQKAGVPECLCGLTEVAQFQNVIEDYQIIVLLPNISTPLSTKDHAEKSKFTYIITKITLTSSLLSLAS